MSMMPIHLDYRRSGGIVGIAMTASVASQDLPAEARRVATDLMTSAPAADDATGVPDGFNHDLTLADGTRTRTYHWQDPHVPEAVQPLLAALIERAKPSSAG
jgi:hypothetical protein